MFGNKQLASVLCLGIRDTLGLSFLLWSVLKQTRRELSSAQGPTQKPAVGQDKAKIYCVLAVSCLFAKVSAAGVWIVEMCSTSPFVVVVWIQDEVRTKSFYTQGCFESSSALVQKAPRTSTLVLQSPPRIPPPTMPPSSTREVLLSQGFSRLQKESLLFSAKIGEVSLTLTQ